MKIKNMVLSLCVIITVFSLAACAQRAVRNQVVAHQASATVDTDAAGVITEAVISNADKISNGNIAVADFTDIDGKEIEEGKILSERIVTRLAMKNGLRFRVIEREKLRQVLDEQKLGLAGLTDDNEGSVGKLLNADAILAGTFLDRGDDREITARLVNVRTGEIFAASSVRLSRKDMNREYLGLSAEQRSRIDSENKVKEELKTLNPRLYGANERVRSEMVLLRDRDPGVFSRCLTIITMTEKVRTGFPGAFFLITEPENSQALKNLQRRNPEKFTKISEGRKRQAFVIRNVPSYREKLALERELAVERIGK